MLHSKDLYNADARPTGAPRARRCATIAREFVRVLIDYRPALRQRTGVGEWVHSLVLALADSSDGTPAVDLTVFSSSWKDRLGPVPKPVHGFDGRVPVGLLNLAWHRLGWPPVEWLTGDTYDVVHSPHPLLIPSRSAQQIVTVHDLDFLDHPDRAEAEVRRDYPGLVKLHVRRADRVIVPSRFTASEVSRRLQVPTDQISVCYNGAPAWTPRTGWPDPGHILFVGALAPRKNISRLLDAYTLLLERRGPTCPLLVLAGPPTARPPTWIDRLEEPPLKNRVRCTGYLDPTALRSLYEDAAVLVLPSLHEGFGLPAVEAMTIGVPVVASNRGALPEVVGEAGLVVNPLEPETIALALERMCVDRPFAHACVERGFQQAAKFTWKASAAALRQAYQAASERRHAAPESRDHVT